MTAPTPGHAIVAPYREVNVVMSTEVLNGLLDDLALAIDEALRIANERAAVAEALAADRLAAVLAAADFAARLARELRVEQA